MTITCQVLLFKAEGLSGLVYAGSALFVSDNLWTKTDESLFDFIWKKTSHHI